MAPWTSVLELNSRRWVTAGSPTALCDAIRRGADLRIHTDFVHNEHFDTQSEQRGTHPRSVRFPRDVSG